MRKLLKFKTLKKELEVRRLYSLLKTGNIEVIQSSREFNTLDGFNIKKGYLLLMDKGELLGVVPYFNLIHNIWCRYEVEDVETILFTKRYDGFIKEKISSKEINKRSMLGNYLNKQLKRKELAM